MAENNCKYYKEIKQVSYDSGQTWTNVDPPQYRKGDLYESGSTDCGTPQCDPIYEWHDNFFCIDGDKYTMQKYQVSYNCGVTWEDVESVESRTRLYEFMNVDCGYELPYDMGETGYTYDSQDPCCSRFYWQIECNDQGFPTKCSKSQYYYDGEWKDRYPSWNCGLLTKHQTCDGNASYVPPMEDDDKIYVDYFPNHSYQSQPYHGGCNGATDLRKNEFNIPSVEYSETTKVSKYNAYIAVGTCVESISNSAFFNQYPYKLSLPSTIKSIGMPQMSSTNCYNFKTVVITTEIPPFFGMFTTYTNDLEGVIAEQTYGPFDFWILERTTADTYIHYSVDKIYVPSGSVEVYKNDSGFTETIPTMREITPYLWIGESVKKFYNHNGHTGYTRTSTCRLATTTTKQISSITNYYRIGSDGEWTTNIQSLLPISYGSKIWTYKVITFSDNSSITIEPYQIPYSSQAGEVTIVSVKTTYKSSGYETGVSYDQGNWSYYADKIIGY